MKLFQLRLTVACCVRARAKGVARFQSGDFCTWIVGRQCGCSTAIGLMDAGCQALAIPNMMDGLGEVIEPLCDVLGSAGEIACETVETHQ